MQKAIQKILDDAVASGIQTAAQVCVYINGELAVDAWAGTYERGGKKKIDGNTLFPIFSTEKPVFVTAAHILHEQGKLDYDKKVCDYWPEFGCNGKEKMEVWHVMSYRAGLFNIPESTPEEQADFQIMTDKMAKAAPAYEIGSKQQYHPWTYGWLTGGIACHVLNNPDT